MLYLGKLGNENGQFNALALIFMCDNDGACSTWEADSGANKIIKLKLSDTDKFCYLDVPDNVPQDLVTRKIKYAVDFVEYSEFDNYEEACASFRNYTRSEEFLLNKSESFIKPLKLIYSDGLHWQKPWILGRFGGQQAFLQGDDEIPYCNICQKSKKFLAMLEEGSQIDPLNFADKPNLKPGQFFIFYGRKVYIPTNSLISKSSAI